jgi:hypothetical protein
VEEKISQQYPERKDTYNGKALNVDHNHETGQVRGLLCPKCNTAIGYLNDDPDLIQHAVNYLQDSPQQT